MPKTPLHKLRLARARTLERIEAAEILLFLYRVRLANVELAINRLAPELPLDGRTLNPNPIFKRGEIGRMALDCLREATAPLAVLGITLAILRAKGVEWPDAQTRRVTRRAINCAMPAWERRGIVRRYGAGNKTRWGLSTKSWA
jgi:hypothetical protein